MAAYGNRKQKIAELRYQNLTNNMWTERVGNFGRRFLWIPSTDFRDVWCKWKGKEWTLICGK